MNIIQSNHIFIDFSATIESKIFIIIIKLLFCYEFISLFIVISFLCLDYEAKTNWYNNANHFLLNLRHFAM